MKSSTFTSSVDARFGSRNIHYVKGFIGAYRLDGRVLETAVIEDEQVGREAGPEGTAGEVDHSLAWTIACKKSPAWMKRSVCPARMGE